MDHVAPIGQVRRRLAGVVERATRHESTIITRNGVEVAAVVPVSLLREWRLWEEQHVLATAAERAGESTYSLNQVLAEVAGTET